VSALSNHLKSAFLFFSLGFLARLITADVRFSQVMAKKMSIFLLMDVGLHGSFELGKAELDQASSGVPLV
jgi:hypothetical protein